MSQRFEVPPPEPPSAEPTGNARRRRLESPGHQAAPGRPPHGRNLRPRVHYVGAIVLMATRPLPGRSPVPPWSSRSRRPATPAARLGRFAVTPGGSLNAPTVPRPGRRAAGLPVGSGPRSRLDRRTIQDGHPRGQPRPFRAIVPCRRGPRLVDFIGVPHELIASVFTGYMGFAGEPRPPATEIIALKYATPAAKLAGREPMTSRSGPASWRRHGSGGGPHSRPLGRSSRRLGRRYGMGSTPG